MRILYVAKHDSGGNDDEGAVVHALESLGHEVVCIDERRGYRAIRTRGDLLLFNKWYDYHTMINCPIPKVFWYWDLVDYPDYTLKARNSTRRQWMKDVLPHTDLGFCTDGDWVSNPWGIDRPYRERLVWLPQGADQRTVGRHEPVPPVRDLVMFGIGSRGGKGRETFVQDMNDWYGERFLLIQRGAYGNDIKQQVARTRIVVAPDAPVTNRYWSNRVYVMLAHGAFLLHPKCDGVAAQYYDGVHLRFYNDREHLKELIEQYRQPNMDVHRHAIALAGTERTKQHHTYTHRVRRLLEVVRERLGVG